MSKYVVLIGIGIALLLFAGCIPDDDYAAQRSWMAQNAEPGDDIWIGLVWPFAGSYDARDLGADCPVPMPNMANDDAADPDCIPYGEYDYLPLGVHMALAEINAEGGILDGRRIRLIQRDDNDSVTDGRLIAQQFAEDTRVMAVIGHAWSYVSVPVAPLYEFNGLIMLSPSATSPELTRSDFRYIFRNVASDAEIGRQLAIYAYNQGYRRVLILYANESYGRELSNVFETEASAFGITIVDRRAYLETERSFDLILSDWQNEDFDAIFIAAGDASEAGQFIRRARALGLDQPIIGGDGLDQPSLWDGGGRSVAGTIVASHFHRDNPRPQLQDFIARFRAYWNADVDACMAAGDCIEADTWAAQGYDAVYLLSYAMHTAGTTDPAAVSDVLHGLTDWEEGVTGPHSYGEGSGDVIGKPIILLQAQTDGFQFYGLADVDEPDVVIEDQDVDITPEPEATTEVDNGGDS